MLLTLNVLNIYLLNFAKVVPAIATFSSSFVCEMTPLFIGYILFFYLIRTPTSHWEEKNKILRGYLAKIIDLDAF